LGAQSKEDDDKLATIKLLDRSFAGLHYDVEVSKLKEAAILERHHYKKE